MIKFAVVGMGPIGSMHIDNIMAGKIGGAALACVCEQRPVSDPKYAGLKIYKDGVEIITASNPPAASISSMSL